jgi:hypothetical protein
MDESVISGANLFWPAQCMPYRGIHISDSSAVGIPVVAGAPGAEMNQWLQGLTTGAPYLACGVLGCWLTYPLNKYLGRRGTLFWCAWISVSGGRLRFEWLTHCSSRPAFGLLGETQVLPSVGNSRIRSTNTWWHFFIA